MIMRLFRRDKPEYEPPEFTVTSRDGNKFRASGCVERCRSVAIHSLSIDRIKRGSEIEAICYADRPLVEKLLSAERRKNDYECWNQVLYGMPTHHIQLGYTVRGDSVSSGQYRSILNWTFNLSIGGSSTEMAQWVGLAISHLLSQPEQQYLYLFNSQESREYWHTVVIRTVVNFRQ